MNRWSSREIKYHADTDKINIVKDKAPYRAERDINISHFKELLTIFQASADPLTGMINQKDFIKAFSKVLGKDLTEDDIMIMFMKIDSDTDNLINWEDFSTYMLLRAEGQKQMFEVSENYFRNVSDNQNKRVGSPHKEMIIRVLYISSLKKYLTCCREGTVCHWNERFKLQRVYPNVGQIVNNEKSKGATQSQTFEGSTHRWIHDLIYIENLQKIAMASDDHQITFYGFP